MIDMTAARGAAQALRDAEGRLREVVNSARSALFAIDRNGVVTLSEGRASRALGLTPGDKRSARASSPIFPSRRPSYDSAMAARSPAKRCHGALLPRQRLLGDALDAHVRRRRPPRGMTGVGSTSAIARSPRRTWQQSMSLSRATLEATTDGILVVDTAATSSTTTAASAEMWNIPRQMPRSRGRRARSPPLVTSCAIPKASSPRSRALRRRPPSATTSSSSSTGSIFERDSRPQSVDGASVGRVWSFRDVTAERHATRRATFLAAASKMLAGPLEDVTPLDVIARLTVPGCATGATSCSSTTTAQVRSAAAYHHDAAKIELLRRLQPDMRQKESPSRRVIATGEPEIDNHITDETLAGPLGEGRHQRRFARAARNLTLARICARAWRCRCARAGRSSAPSIFASSRTPSATTTTTISTLAMDLAQRAALAIDNAAPLPGEPSRRWSCATSSSRSPRTSCARRSPRCSSPCRARSRVGRRRDAPRGVPAARSLELAPSGRRAASAGWSTTLLDVSRIPAGRLELQREPSIWSRSCARSSAASREDARRAGCALDASQAPSDRVVGNGTGCASSRSSRTCCRTRSSTAPASRSTIASSATARRARAGRARSRHRHRRRPSTARIFERFERAVSRRALRRPRPRALHRAPASSTRTAATSRVESAPGGGAHVHRRAAALTLSSALRAEARARASGRSAAAARQPAARRRWPARRSRPTCRPRADSRQHEPVVARSGPTPSGRSRTARPRAVP